ncbi:lyso-ornithine lipid acyltransferase [Oryzisolibacter propanilivorax]|uniref:Lyso-ornithine lipid acyltransferase n=1 Tax=Oryzisolibacter propanilivorax TaxID=1527607 RepID=A0A1G9UYK0_9BURK|nr:lysophospholipid acyltransferase family protein [Oryzisolibacter propanilivorax]SDM64953.1 lyso-ornithine lipid acyltransferase [Oryzisolibacter propanilivorax]
MVRHLRAAWRLLRLLLHVLHGLAIVALRFPRLGEDRRQAHVQAWALALLAHAGIRLQVRGTPAPAGPVLLVANHASWLDIPLLHAARYCRFVSKADVQDWPLVGTLATAAGTLFLARESRRGMLQTLRGMRAALQAGEVLALFPEGTTGDGRALLPFHANLLQAAIDAGVPVQPVALGFADAASGAPSLAPCWPGDESLLRAVWRTLAAPPLVAWVHFGAPEPAQGRERRAWAAALREQVQALRHA